MRNYNMTHTREPRCGCMQEPSFSDTAFPPAMAYVPWQYFTTVYETDKALEVGTIFPELDRPFLAAGRCGRA